jgi:hypothetical protein
MTASGRLMRWVLVLAFASLGAACTTMKTVTPATDPSKPRFGPVRAGDTVVLHLHDGRRMEITVARVERDALVSAEGVRYPHADITQLQRRSLSGVKTLGLVGGIYLATVAALALAVAILWGS